MREIMVKTPSMTSTIYIGEDVIAKRLPVLASGQTNFVVTDENVYALYGEWLRAKFPKTEFFILPSGEEHKNFSSLQTILEKMTQAGLRRTARLFAVGGGVVGDIGGLAASLYMRGISYVQIPTTLLAQVDSSVGGKTAVDLNGVKNVVGAFYQPCEVWIDPTFLKTLPEREIKCGVGEIVKYAALNAEILRLIEENTERICDLGFLTTLVEECVRHKAKVVEIDEKETGERKSLNVGHTTGHAIELTSGLSHGESVLYGMLFETRMAVRAGVCDRAHGERVIQLVEKALALAPCSKPDFSKIETDAEKARSDKKNTENGEIMMAVAQDLGAWTLFSMPLESYKSALAQAVKDGR
ncbi:MAG: 3-dehydroquinate synthase [Clostridia bacterium]|nr:3-dehydroquinate synthase [Clostridia bacterium]